MLDGDVQVLDDLGLPGDDVDEFVVDLVGIEVVEPNPMEGQLAELSEELAQTAAAVEVGAIPGNVLGNDQQLLHAAVRQAPGLLQQGLEVPAAVAAPEVWDDTVGAAVIAALGDLQVGGIGGRGHHTRAILDGMVDVPEVGGGVPLHDGLDGGNDVGVAAGAQDTVHLGQLLQDLILVALGKAAGHQQLFQFTCAFQRGDGQNGVDGLTFGRVNKAAGVDHRYVGPLGLSGDGVARRPAQSHHLLGVHQILGTAQGYECNFQVDALLLCSDQRKMQRPSRRGGILGDWSG